MTGLDFECALQKKQEVNLLKVALKKKKELFLLYFVHALSCEARKEGTQSKYLRLLYNDSVLKSSCVRSPHILRTCFAVLAILAIRSKHKARTLYGQE